MLSDMERRIRAYRRKTIPAEGLIPAAVAVPILVGEDGSARLVFTLRTDHVEHHKGEISFPGGRTDPDDENAAATALRETWEEIGISPRALRPVGLLDDFISITGYRVTPVVVVADKPVELQAQPSEVADILAVPLPHLLDPKHRLPPQGHPETGYHTFVWNGHRIWGLTGNILHHFLTLAFGETYEAPPAGGKPHDFDAFVAFDRESHDLLREYHRWLLSADGPALEAREAGDLAHAADRYLRDFVVDILELPPLATDAEAVRSYLANWYPINTLTPTHDEIDRIARALSLLHRFLAATGRIALETDKAARDALASTAFYHQRLESFWDLTPEAIAPWRAVCDYRGASKGGSFLQ